MTVMKGEDLENTDESQCVLGIESIYIKHSDIAIYIIRKYVRKEVPNNSYNSMKMMEFAVICYQRGLIYTLLRGDWDIIGQLLTPTCK